MRKRAVGLGHFVGVDLLFDGVAFALRGGDKLGGELFGEAVVSTGAGVLDNPAESEGDLPVFGDLYRHLIGCAADPARFNCKLRANIIDSPVENVDSAFLGAFLDYAESLINDPLSGRFFAFFQFQCEVLSREVEF